jgi:hypothetical protein
VRPSPWLVPESRRPGLIIHQIHDIQNIVDISRTPDVITRTKRTLRAGEQRFIDEIASLLAPWGLPPSSGRVYGYLLLTQTPLCLDQIALDLGMSKAGAWSSARNLEGFGHVRRYGVPGTKRALYAPSDNFAAPLLEQAALLGNIAGALQSCASTIAAADAAIVLRERALFYETIRKAMETAIEVWNARGTCEQR